MTEQDRPVDLAQIAADDALFDALGRGAAAPADDELAGVLATWRADLDLDQPEGAVEVPLDLVLETHGKIEIPADLDETRPPARWGRRLVAAAAAAVLLIGGLLIAVDSAGPTSPLWPLTRVMYPQQADAKLAEHTIARARAATTAGRPDEARRLLDEADGIVDRIRDRRLAQRLRDEIARIRASLPGADGSTGSTSDSPGTAPGNPAPSPAPAPPGGSGGPAGPGGNPGGAPTTQGGVVPGVPPVTTPPLPVPSLPLPSLPLPSLPIPTLP